MKASPWYSISNEQVLERLSTTVDGLASAEAQQRLAAQGPNEIEEQQRRPEPLSTRIEALRDNLGEQTRVGGDRSFEPKLEPVEVLLESGV